MRTKRKWKNLSLAKKIRLVIRLIGSIIVIVLAILGLFDIIDSSITNNLVMPIIAVVMILTGIDEYTNNQKVTAYFSFGTAIFILLVGLSIFLRF